MSTKPRLAPRFAALAATFFCSGLAGPAACTGPAASSDDGGAYQKCFVGDRLCVDDAFDLAEEMLREHDWDWVHSNDLLLVATGTIEDARAKARRAAASVRASL